MGGIVSQESDYLTTTEFARRVRASANAVKLWCASGKLQGCFKTPGGHWRIPSSNLTALGIDRAGALMETTPKYAAGAGAVAEAAATYAAAGTLAAPSPAKVREDIHAMKSEVADFCRRNRIHKLALFGSILGEDFRPDSDIDVLVEFQPEAVVGLFDLGGMQLELSQIFSREVDLRTSQDLSRYFRDEVVSGAEVLYEE